MVQPTVDEYATYCLYKHAVPMTVAEIAADIGYSHGYTREALRDLRSRGEIEGAKTDPVIACNVHGDTIVITSNFDGMMDNLESASASLAKKARSQVTYGNVSELQKFIKRHAAATYQIERRWEFWYPTPSPAGGSTSPPASAA